MIELFLSSLGRSINSSARYVRIYIPKINVQAATTLVVDRIGSQPNFGLMQNSGFQYHFVEHLVKSCFVNTRLILEPKLIANKKHKLSASIEY